jgi:hypothetical protein
MQSEPDVFVRVLFVCMFLFFGTFFVFSTIKKKRSNVPRDRFEIWNWKKCNSWKKKLCLKWNDPSLLFLLHMLDLSLPLLKFFFGFLIVTPPESHLSLILANWTIQFLPAPEKSSNWSFFWNLGSLSPDSPSQTKTIDLVVCYIRMFISGPFKQLFISFLGLRQFIFCVWVCASTTSFLFCCHLRHEFCVCPLDHALAHPRLHLIFKMILYAGTKRKKT